MARRDDGERAERFREAMTVLRGAYPSYRPSEAEFKATLLTYYRALDGISLRAVSAAIMRAPDPDCYPDWFPTAGQLKRLALSEDAKARLQEAGEAEAARRKMDDAMTRERYRHVPSNMFEQKEYLESAPNEFEALARKMELDTIAGRRDPVGEAPAEVARRWGKELGDVMRRSDLGPLAAPKGDQQATAGDDRHDGGDGHED